MVAQVKASDFKKIPVPYQGPGIESDPTGPATGLTFEDRVRQLTGTPAGMTPPPDAAYVSAKLSAVSGTAGLFNTGTDKQGHTDLMLGYHPTLSPYTVAMIDFADSNCFPLADQATSTPQALPATTVFTDLSTYSFGDVDDGQRTAVPYPNTATSGTAAPMTYISAPLSGRTAIVFTDNNASPTAEAINIMPTGADTFSPMYPPDRCDQAFWAIGIETPAALSANTDAAIFTVGDQLDATLQVAFCVKAGQFGVYVNGTNFVSYNVTPAVSTKYLLGVHYYPDPDDANYFMVQLYKDGALQGTAQRFPWPVNETPWVLSGARTLAQGGATPVAGFGPKAAFGAAWSYYALGYFAEDMSAASGNPGLRQPLDMFVDFGQAFGGVIHAV